MAMSRLTEALADRYRIERELGAGGMATVYLAQDLKHDRKVAVKVLRPELAAVIGADRFLAEIKTTANLQHPHILPLFDSGAADSFLYYVMPFIEGESLRDRLNREKQLSIGDAVRIATEVASALDYAHRHNVIHRDIKPENVLLHDGRALVADFGIALAASKAGGGRMTETGMSLGTPTYMSPEQAMGEREITARSDVYALGAMTYEMLAGDPPFTGSTAQAIVAKVMTDEPAPLRRHRKAVPEQVDDAVLTALEKLPADRWGSAREFAEALSNSAARATSRRPAVRAGGGLGMPVRHPLVIGLALALVAALGVAFVQWRAAHQTAEPAVVRFNLTLPSSMLVSNAAQGKNVQVSPDGSTIVYALGGEDGTVHLYVRPLEDETAHLLAGTDGAQQPCFSPDGKWIAYIVSNTVWKVQVSGGAPVSVAPLSVGPLGLTWSHADEILIGSTTGLIAVPAAGGAARVAVKLDSNDQSFVQPYALADGHTVLVAAGSLSQTRLARISLQSGRVERFDLPVMDVLGYVDGILVYVVPSGALMAVPFDVSQGKVKGVPVALGPTAVSTISSASQAALSITGTLIYQPLDAGAALGWVDAGGRFQPLLTSQQAYAYPRLSPDGRQVAMAIGNGNRSDVWIHDIASGTLSRITNSGTTNDRPEWNPDGRRVLYRADRGSRTGIWWQAADLSDPATPLEADANHFFFEGVLAPDGRTLVYQVDDGGADQANVMYRRIDGDTATRPVAASSFVEAQARVSPDGRWVAYVTDASGTSQVVVRPFPGPGGVIQVSIAGGSEPVWARDGRRLFYRDGRHLIAASITTTPSIVVTGRKELFRDDYLFAQAPHANYDVSLDGTRFLMVKSAGEPKLFVVYGWLGQLRQRVRSAQAVSR
jgi:serine/threonine protein kinase/Tol biopolymer transport system component